MLYEVIQLGQAHRVERGAGLLGGLFQRVAVLQDAESVVVERERVLGGGGAGYGL